MLEYIKYHYLIISFQSGCLNGGGQLRPEEDESAKDLLSRLDTIYNEPPASNPKDNTVVDTLYMEWLGGHDTDKARTMLHTTYKEVEKINNALTIKW